LGFTTPSKHSRSSRYSADVGKMIGTPIFIVNGESLVDVERVMKIAVKYRMKFKKDVIVELVNYRKHVRNLTF
jgi:multifunctional 2-oxoglutarate metabolism enzyme